MKTDMTVFQGALENLGDILLILGAGVAAVLSKKIKGYIDDRQKRKLEKSIIHNSVIREMLSELRALYNCDRVKLFQFHNGDYFLSGESSMKVTMTHYVLRVGVSVPNPTPGTHQNIQTSHLVHTLKEMKVGPYFMTMDEDEADPVLLYLFGVSGTKSALFAPVKDVRGNWLGFLSLTWLTELETDLQIGKGETIVIYAEQIGALMSKKF